MSYILEKLTNNQFVGEADSAVPVSEKNAQINLISKLWPASRENMHDKRILKRYCLGGKQLCASLVVQRWSFKGLGSCVDIQAIMFAGQRYH